MDIIFFFFISPWRQKERSGNLFLVGVLCGERYFMGAASHFGLKSTLQTKEQAKKEMRWYLFDASGKVLGRLAVQIARVLTGRHKVDYTPHIDDGDGVIVINAEKIVVSGNKMAGKSYFRHSGFVGGLKETTFSTMLQRKPAYIIQHAVKGMVPKSRLGKQQLKKLRVFAGEAHDLVAQQPIRVDI